MSDERDLEIEEDEEKKGKRLTPAEWQEITNLFEMGMMKAKDIAEKFGVSRSAIHQHFKKHDVKWAVRKEEMEKAVEEKVITFASKRKQRIEETKNQCYEMDAAASAYGRKMLADAIKGSIPLSTKEKELKALHKLVAINQMTREGRYKVLEIDLLVDETTLPPLQFQDLSKDRIEKMREQDEDELEDLLSVGGDDEDIVEEGT